MMAGGLEKRVQSVALTGVTNSMTRLLVHRLGGDSRFRVVVIDQEGDLGEVRHYPVDVSRPGAEERIGEILESEGIDVFVHLGLSTELSRTPNLTHEIETQGSMHVLSACSGYPVRKLVLMSTTMLYGARADNSAWLGEESRLRAERGFQFFGDKIEVEGLFGQFGEKNPERIVTVLRLGPVLGPNTVNVYTRFLGSRVVPLLAGYDPPVQLLHEVDAVRAFEMVIGEDHPGVFNVVGDSVVPLATAVRILGHAPVPVVEPLAGTVLGALWSFRVGGVPAELVPYLKYPFLASGEKAAAAFGFTASYPPVEIISDFGRAMKKRRLERVGQ